MKIAFTICSNNYLAQAKTLASSFIKFNSDYTFYLFIVDELLEGEDYIINPQIKHEPIANVINEELLQSLCNKMAIIELNTAVKASCFKYLIAKHKESKCFFYIDPDIMIFHSFLPVESQLSTSSIILTPHVLAPIVSFDKQNLEKGLLLYGVYNLGFIGINIQFHEALIFLDWWEDRLLKMGIIEPFHHLFVDQKWADFIPGYFNNVFIARDWGYNMAPWNLHERTVTEYGKESITINNSGPLVFYHFSNYRYTEREQICRAYSPHTFRTRPDLENLYTLYYNELISNGIEVYSNIKCKYKLAGQKNLIYRAVNWLNHRFIPFPY